MKKIFLILLPLLFMFSSCESVISLEKTNEMADNSFKNKGEIVCKGNIFYDMPTTTELFAFFKKKENYTLEANDIFIKGERLPKSKGAGLTKEFASDFFISNTTVTIYEWKGYTQFDGTKKDLRFVTHVGYRGSKDKDYLLKSSECQNIEFNFLDKYRSMHIQTPYKAAECRCGENREYSIYATKQTYYNIVPGKKVTEEQLANTKQPEMDMKEAFNSDEQLFQVIEGDGIVLADFTKSNFTIYDTAENPSSVKEFISAFLGWLKSLEEHESSDGELK